MLQTRWRAVVKQGVERNLGATWTGLQSESELVVGISDDSRYVCWHLFQTTDDRCSMPAGLPSCTAGCSSGAICCRAVTPVWSRSPPTRHWAVWCRNAELFVQPVRLLLVALEAVEVIEQLGVSQPEVRSRLRRPSSYRRSSSMWKLVLLSGQRQVGRRRGRRAGRRARSAEKPLLIGDGSGEKQQWVGWAVD